MALCLGVSPGSLLAMMGRVFGIPGRGVVEALLLHPAFEIVGGDFVGGVQQGVVGFQERDGGTFHRHPVVGQGHRVGADLGQHGAAGHHVLHHEVAPGFHVFEQLGLLGFELVYCVVGADAQHHGVVAGESVGGEVGGGVEQGDGVAELAQGFGHFVAGAHEVAHGAGFAPAHAELHEGRGGFGKQRLGGDVGVVDGLDAPRIGLPGHGGGGPQLGVAGGRAGAGAQGEAQGLLGVFGGQGEGGAGGAALPAGRGGQGHGARDARPPGPQRDRNGFGLGIGKDVGAGGGQVHHDRRHHGQGLVEFAQRGVGVFVLDGDAQRLLLSKYSEDISYAWRQWVFR